MQAILRLILFPIRIIQWFFRSLSRLFGGARSGAGTVAGAAGEVVGSRASPSDPDFEPETQSGAAGLEALLFRQLPRPRLQERSAAELTIDEARELVAQAHRFYNLDFSLFARSDFFYEEVEDEFLRDAMGYQDHAVDRRYIDVMTRFRKGINTNTRWLNLYYIPVLIALSLGAAVCAVASDLFRVSITQQVSGLGIGLPEETLYQATVFAIFAVVGWILVSILYNWPFKVTQQRNLLNLDNYITSKFGRINQNFQVAKRRALNVERDKRMSDVAALKEEAGIWTLAYQWLGMRLLLCELMIRNRMYQLRRNTTLYWIGGFVVSVLAASALNLAVQANLPADATSLTYCGVDGGRPCAPHHLCDLRSAQLPCVSSGTGSERVEPVPHGRPGPHDYGTCRRGQGSDRHIP